MIKKLRAKLLDRKGYSYPFIAVLILVFLLIAFGLFETIRANLLASNIRDKFQNAIIAESVLNYDRVYDTMREGYAASYQLAGFSWKESNSTTRNRIMKAITDGFTGGEASQLTILHIDFTVEPSAVAPTDKENSIKFNVTGTITVEIPYSFAWRDLAPMVFTTEVKSEWRMMF
jgi:hypothetical protein